MQALFHVSKRILRFVILSLLGLGLFVGGYFLMAWGLSRLETNHKKEAGHEAITLYIKTNGVHTDIVVPVKTNYKDWSKDIAFANTRGADSTYTWLGMGWGDKGFYLETPTWADLKVSTAFKAAFALSTTAIHATYYQNMNVGSDCRAISVSPRQYQLLIQYIEKALQHTSEGGIIPIPTDAVYGNHDAFYEAHGAYSMFHTCNTWTNNALKACEQKAAWWTPFDWGIFYHYPASL
jgi:uncharacterized protein (TIGR02117 family)